MPRSVAAMMSLSVVSFSPGRSETFGMRWNCTQSHESAYEQPCDCFDAGERRDPRRLLARGLVVLEDSLVDDQPLVRGNAFVVPRAEADRVFLRAVALDVHERLPYLSLPIIFSGGATKLVPAKFAS